MAEERDNGGGLCPEGALIYLQSWRVEYSAKDHLSFLFLGGRGWPCFIGRQMVAPVAGSYPLGAIGLFLSRPGPAHTGPEKPGAVRAMLLPIQQQGNRAAASGP